MRLETIPILLGILVALAGALVMVDAWGDPERGPMRERRRRIRASIDRRPVRVQARQGLDHDDAAMPGDGLVGPGREGLGTAADREQHLAGTTRRDGDRDPPDLADKAFLPAHGHISPAFSRSRRYWYTPGRHRADPRA